MSTKLKHNETQKKQRPVETFREGAVAAHVWNRQTPTGFEYLEFSLSRSWKLKSSEKEGYSNHFFEQNQAALATVIAQAADSIRKHSKSQDDLEQTGNGTSTIAAREATTTAEGTQQVGEPSSDRQ